jgi:gliding motility-associated-like protein
MRHLLGLIFFIALIEPVQAQNNFSFNCTKDTTIECTSACITLKTVIPDIYSSTNSYSVNQVSALSCFRGYADPAAPGQSTKLTIDDRYSPPIDISFPFSFFGTNYSQLIASTNGFLSFDIAKTGAFSHFGILKNGAALSATSGIPQDLPSALYDKALIMGPYHDLDPNISTSTQQIKYEVVGTAPYRKWIISYYNVPLYTTACLNLSFNTHQIVLYETLNIVEVFIYDKAICLNWNNGRAMIGMQDFNKTSSIMAPGRKATDAPWGSKGMNESWRFVPAAGQSLFKRVELYTLSGTFLQNGNTTNAGNNLLNVSFPNVCPPSTGGSYLVRSVYKNPNDPSAEIVGIDTINISRGDPISVNINPTTCAQGSKGSIIITSPIGPSYEYSLDGNSWQPSTIFNVPGGTYTLQTRIIGSSCISKKTVFVVAQTFEASIAKFITPCTKPITAYIKIFPRYGTPQYNYSLDGGPFQTSNIFTGLTIGTYKVLITDAAGCSYSTEIRIDSTNLASAETTNTICSQAGSGTINVTAGFGAPPYSFSLNGGPFQSSNIFTGLAEGTYNITVRDSSSCDYTFGAVVKSDVILGINPEIKMPACYGNSNAKIILHPSLGKRPYLFSLNNSPFQTDSTFKDLKSGNYVVHVKDSTGCIKDSSLTVEQPNPVSGTPIITPASNCVSNDGQITVKANGGVPPFMFSIDNEVSYQVSNVFTAPAGLFNIVIKDSNNCKSTVSDTVPAANNTLFVDLGPDKTICNGSSTTITINTNQPAIIYNSSPAAGITATTSQSVVVQPVDTTTYIISAKTAVCKGSDSITINVLHKPLANAGADTMICNNTYAVLHGSATNISGNVSYLWAPANDVETPNSFTTIVHPKNNRPQRYRLEVSDNYGCNFKVYDDVIVTMKEQLRAFAGNDTIAALEMPHQLFGSGGTQYLWSPANVLNNPLAQNPITVLQRDTRFYLTVKDTLGCIGTSSVFIKVYRGPTYYVPNAFTPNGDGLNDIFKAVAPGIKQTNYFRIFDRWGKLIFESRDINKGWDGRYLGLQQPSDVYVWIIKGIDITGKVVEFKGTVTLIR